MTLSEADFQRRVMDTAKLAGWLCVHYRPAQTQSGRWSTPLSGNKGAPDLLLAKDGRVLLAELKADKGRPTLEQQAWLAELGAHGRLWSPANWETVLLDLGVTKRRPLSAEDIRDRTDVDTGGRAVSEVRTPARCGTPSGYQKHQRHHETPCDACARAKSVYDKRWRSATDRQKRDRLSARAQSRALSILRGRYEAEYSVLYATERDRLFAAADLGVGTDRDEGEQT